LGGGNDSKLEKEPKDELDADPAAPLVDASAAFPLVDAAFALRRDRNALRRDMQVQNVGGRN
jgi:hypothetical protein